MRKRNANAINKTKKSGRQSVKIDCRTVSAAGYLIRRPTIAEARLITIEKAID